MTGEGWIEALVRAGEYDHQALADRLGRLAAYFKGNVKGRHTAACLDLKTASNESSLSEEWIYNVIESNLLEVKFGTRGAHWHASHHGRIILIPVTFGVEPVDANASLHGKIERLEEELADREERLSEFLCPHCKAPMTTQVFAPHEYGDELVQWFECGYGALDGVVCAACPSSPEFPTLEEFDFQFFELKDDGHRKWSCSALPKTRQVRLVDLPQGLGRTREEARNYVIEHYTPRARPWKR